jgi:hypothetical protein
MFLSNIDLINNKIYNLNFIAQMLKKNKFWTLRNIAIDGRDFIETDKQSGNKPSRGEMIQQGWPFPGSTYRENWCIKTKANISFKANILWNLFQSEYFYAKWREYFSKRTVWRLWDLYAAFLLLVTWDKVITGSTLASDKQVLRQNVASHNVFVT